jgi:hypothetical protein
MKDDEPTPEELREAEALARALDGAPSDSAAPPEALEVAALLRHAKSEGALDPARTQALAAKLRAGVRPPRRRWLWIALAPVAAGVTAMVVLALTPIPEPVTVSRLRSLPVPAASLLQAQAEAARGQPRALADLDAQMRAYRQTLFGKLRERRR